MPSNKSVFISHSHNDNPWCRVFADALKAAGIDVWYDEKGLQGGADWLKTLEDEIESRDILVLVLTPASWQSEWVQRELRLALSVQGKTIIPVLLQPTSVTGFLRTIQWVDVVGLNGATAAVKVASMIAPPVVSPPIAGSFSPSPPKSATLHSPYPSQSVAPMRSASIPPPSPIYSPPTSLREKPAQTQNTPRRLPFIGIASLVVVALLAFFIFGPLHHISNSTNGQSNPITLTIGSDLPTSGEYTGEGIPTQNGVQLAIQQNQSLGHGYTLAYTAKNDVNPTSGTRDPAIGVRNIQSLLSDTSTVAIVGPFNSSVAVAEIPIINQDSVTLISPTNTNPGLTLQQYASDNGINFAQLHPAGKPNCYFRIASNDVVQGGILADFSVSAKPKGLGFHTVYIVDDNETYGAGLASFFRTEFTTKGGIVLGSDSITDTQASTIQSVATKIEAANPDFVFYGGVTSGGGGTLKADLGANVPLVGGDGIADDPAWITSAGAAASANTFGSVAGPDTSTLTSGLGATFTAAYKSAFPGKDLLPYSAQAYDATKIIIQAIQSLITSGKAVTRANVCAAVQGIQYDGVTGQMKFDPNGDNAGQRVFSIYHTDTAGTWSYFKQVIG